MSSTTQPLRDLLAYRDAQTTATHGGDARAAVRAWDKANARWDRAVMECILPILDAVDALEELDDAISSVQDWNGTCVGEKLAKAREAMDQIKDKS